MAVRLINVKSSFVINFLRHLSIFPHVSFGGLSIYFQLYRTGNRISATAKCSRSCRCSVYVEIFWSNRKLLHVIAEQHQRKEVRGRERGSQTSKKHIRDARTLCSCSERFFDLVKLFTLAPMRKRRLDYPREKPTMRRKDARGSGTQQWELRSIHIHLP